MANTDLTVPFKDKDAAKALGARWDGAQRQWFVPDGRELTPFAAWLPPGVASVANTSALELTPVSPADLAASAPRKGISLSTLLAGVSQAVAQAYKAGIWTLVEVVELRATGGHVFLGVSERDAQGAVLAKTSAVIWQSTASTILPEFERATGAQLAAGIKLLVRARPVFKPQYGFSIEIDAIDPEYTLGDLEAQKREIRERLQAEGVFAANRERPSPWDFNAVLVVAPAGGAGLGDFQVEANRLEKFGVCRFTYVFSRFQGEGAANEIGDALRHALLNWKKTVSNQPDAVVIIRGGGAVNDMAWLNDYGLTRLICDLPIPVLTGIGHERDSTVLDEVANLKFDTPSKVIAGIEQQIVKRVSDAKAYFEQIAKYASQGLQTTKADVVSLDKDIRAQAARSLAAARQISAALVSDIRVEAMGSMRSASEQSRETYQSIKMGAAAQMTQARRDTSAWVGDIASGTRHAIRSRRLDTNVLVSAVIDRAGRDVVQTRTVADQSIGVISSSARAQLSQASAQSQALMREISGQGPASTLGRGFALVRTPKGRPITRAADVSEGSTLEIQFSDGKLVATAGEQR